MASKLMEPVAEDDYEPTEEEIQEYAQALGFILPDDNDLLYIAREGLKAPLPPDWRVASTADGDIYYYHKDKREPTWDHPMDEFYKKKFEEEKARRAKKTNVLTFTKMTLPKESAEEKLLTSGSSNSGSSQGPRDSVERPSSLPQLSVINLTGSLDNQEPGSMPSTANQSIIPTTYREFQSPLSGINSSGRVGDAPSVQGDSVQEDIPNSDGSKPDILKGILMAQMGSLPKQEASSPGAVNETASELPSQLFGAKDMIELSKQHAQEMAELSKAHGTAITDLCEVHAKEILKLREEHSEGIKKMKQDLNEEYKREYKTLREEFDRKVTELREAHDRQMKKLDSMYGDEVRQAKQKYDSLMSDKDGYERRIADLKVEQSRLLAEINVLEQSLVTLKQTVSQLTVQQQSLLGQLQAQGLQQKPTQLPSPTRNALPKDAESPKTLLHTVDIDAFSGFGNFIVYCLPDPARSALLSEVLRLRVIGDYLRQEKRHTDLRVKAMEARRAAFVTQSKIASEETNSHGGPTTSNSTIQKIYEERKQIDADSREVNRAISIYKRSSDWLAEKKLFTNTLLRFLINSVSRKNELLAALSDLFNEYTDVFENRTDGPCTVNAIGYSNGRLSTGFVPLTSLETPDARSTRGSGADPGPSRRQKESYIRGKILELFQINDYKLFTTMITGIYGVTPGMPGGSMESLSSSIVINQISTAIGANKSCCGRIVQDDDAFYLERREPLPDLVAKLWRTELGTSSDGPAPPRAPEIRDAKKKILRGEEYFNEKGQKIIVPTDDSGFIVMVPDVPPPVSKTDRRQRRRFTPEIAMVKEARQTTDAEKAKASSKWLDEYRVVTKGYI